MRSDQLTRAERAIEGAADEARSVVELCQRVHDAIAPLVPADRWCGFAVDPATLLPTNGYHDEGIAAEHLQRLLEIEHGVADWNQLPALARSASGVATLHEATAGDPAVSTRWRDVLEPAGLPHELRAAIRERRGDGSRTWGALVLLRASDDAGFTGDDTGAVARLAPGIAAGLRRVLVRQHLDHADDAREAGIIVLGGDPLEIRHATPAARAWLAQLDEGGESTVPTCVLSAVHACRSSAPPAAIRARTRSGRWVTITAERMDHPGGNRRDREFGVVVQPSRPSEVAAIIGAAHRLTRRESDVVTLVAAGRSNQEVARALGVSAHTVGDHLKNIFAKLGVATRGEMTSKLYHDHYLPRELAGLQAGGDGWFLPG